jgi:hypothetical protein
MFPGGDYNSANEAGFCGYGIHRELISPGIKNIVINAADKPTSQKDHLEKRDPIDSTVHVRRGSRLKLPRLQQFILVSFYLCEYVTITRQCVLLVF